MKVKMSEESAKEIVKILRDHGYMKYVDHIEKQLLKPKPDEPKGLGAVIRARDGSHFVRVACNKSWPDWKSESYLHAGEHRYRWSEVDAVEVLSEGVQT